MRRGYIILFVALFTFVATASAQRERSHIIEGNNLYDTGDFVEAELSYLEALAIDSASVYATFNQGNALYRQKKFEDARTRYERVVDNTKDDGIKASSYHNIGNTYMQANNFTEAITAYKESLKLNDDDEATRYNLALANALLKKEQAEKEQQEKEDKNKENQQKKQEQQQKQQQEQQKSEQQMSKETARQILEAFEQDEKDLKNKNEQQMRFKGPKNIKNNW